MGKIYLGETKLADIAPVTSVNSKTGDITLTYSDVGGAAASHTHAISDVTDLQTTLDKKLESAPVTSVNNKTGAVSLTYSDVGAQASLGFTPVQQGGGTNQLSNKVYIGWTGSTLDLMVDSTNMGSILYSGTAKSAVLPLGKGGTGATTAANARTNLGLGAAATCSTTTATAKTHTNYNTNQGYLPTMAFLSFWNGAYNSSNSSNLTYCAQGTIIGSSNIGSQSVSSATNATNATYATNAKTTTVTTSSLKNIYGGTGAMTASSTSLTTGTIYLQYT